MAEVRLFFSTLTDAETLLFCLGLEDCSSPRFADVPLLAYSATVICFDTEHWNADSNKLTEIGFNRFSIESTRSSEPGPWGENFLRAASFYHARIAENSHLESRSKRITSDPTRNRFGRTRFLTSKEACNALEEFFAVRSADGTQICPVVILGHALDGDAEKLQTLLDFDLNRLDNVVKQIDTQQIVRDMGYWTGHDQVGLQKIISEMGFEYRDAHTASNDAAMTLIAAVLLVLPENGFSKDKGLQEVVDGIERLSQDDEWDHGSEKYCRRCHSFKHFAATGGHRGGPCRVRVHCQHCEDAGRTTAVRSHKTEDCISYALDNGNSKKAMDRGTARRNARRVRAEMGGYTAAAAAAAAVPRNLRSGAGRVAHGISTRHLQRLENSGTWIGNRQSSSKPPEDVLPSSSSKHAETENDIDHRKSTMLDYATVLKSPAPSSAGTASLVSVNSGRSRRSTSSHPSDDSSTRFGTVRPSRHPFRILCDS